jgi:uncharacterized cupredoxin-like copper-binding protein
MRAANGIRTLGVLAGALVVLTSAGGPGSSSVQAAGPEEVTLRIGVTLNEYSFAPEPIRIPAGRPVTLVIRNAGKVPHEFMAGREVEGNDFRQDLFADLHVNIEPAEPVAAAHGDHGDHGLHASEHAEADEHAAGHDHEAEHDAPADAGHAHGAGHEHGTMVEAAAGQTFLMTFALPEDRRGEWETGCFLSGHYEAGMHGTLIVE